MARSSNRNLKLRTRAHVIADLSINHVERQVLLAGFTAQRAVHDYGLDLHIATYTETGEVEMGLIYAQVRATDDLKKDRVGRNIRCRIERSHLRAWMSEAFPVILIVYDAQNNQAYWLYVQARFGGVKRFRAMRGTNTLTVRVPVSQVLDPAAVCLFRTYRKRIQAQTEGAIHRD